MQFHSVYKLRNSGFQRLKWIKQYSGKMKILPNLQWILIEQTCLYTVVYRTFLYNQTNLKVPKNAPCSMICSNPRYSWVTYFVLSNFCNLSYLLNPCCFINFCHLINLSSSYQTSVIFLHFVIYLLFILSTHPINAPAVHTANPTLFPVLSCARSLR